MFKVLIQYTSISDYCLVAFKVKRIATKLAPRELTGGKTIESNDCPTVRVLVQFNRALRDASFNVHEDCLPDR